MEFHNFPANTAPLIAVAREDEVVLSCAGPWPVDVAFTPEAILASLDGLRAAAELAFRQRV